MGKNPKVAGIVERFELDASDLKCIIKNFLADMERGLAGRNSSLKMLPAYVARPSGRETGSFLAIDLGGTNFRILEVVLKGNGRTRPPHVMKFKIQRRYREGSGEKLFDFIAGCVEKFMRERNIDLRDRRELGFTFSFPVKQTGVAAGKLICWTKGFHAKGVVGEDVVGFLSRALEKRGLYNIEVAALANDTVGTLAACSYLDSRCDAGVILGTGTNACYPEKFPGMEGIGHEMIVNIEWGNFNKLKRTRYDRALDRSSSNPGHQLMEKMVSGMYLGEIARLVLMDLSKCGILDRRYGAALRRRYKFKTEYMSVIENDASGELKVINRILRTLGIARSTVEERRAIREICAAISRRGARLAAAAIAAVVKRMDPRLGEEHTIAIDGSVYEKHPVFKQSMKEAFRELFGGKASRISMRLVRDGSGKGAAIIAAIAYAGKDTACR